MTVCRISTKPKFEAINRFLLDEHVLIHLNPRAEGVIVPGHLAKGEVLTLKLSKLFRGAMEVTKEKVTADLLFDNDYFTCVVPLDAIWGATSTGGETLVWPESAPAGVLKSVAPAAAATAPGGETPVEENESTPSPRKKGHLTRVK